MSLEFDHDLVMLSGFLSDRFIISKALNEGFEPSLLRSKPAQNICNAILELYGSKREGQTIDATSLKGLLIEKGMWQAEIEEYYQHIIEQEVPQLSLVMSSLEVLKIRASRIKLAQVSAAISSYLSNRGEDKEKAISDFTAELIHQLSELRKRQLRRRALPMKYKLDEIERDLSLRKEGEVIENLGYPLKPFNTLNAALSGLRRGFYYGLAGAPRRGKTNLALELASIIAGNSHIPVLYYSWEQTSRVLALRLLGKESQINPTFLQAQGIKGMEDRYELAKNRVSRYINYLYLIEGGRKDTIERIKAQAYNLMQEYEKDDVAIFIDYLQKIPTDKLYTDPKAKIDEISSGLAELSLELNCPVFAISALDKEGCKLDERDSGTRPTMHHSTGSGDIEYDLDVALILAKDWYYSHELNAQLREFAKAREIPEENIPKLEIINLYIDKNRDAPPATSDIIQYLFFIEENKFLELGYKDITLEYTYNKIAKLIKELVAQKLIFASETLEESRIGEEKIKDIIYNPNKI